MNTPATGANPSPRTWIRPALFALPILAIVGSLVFLPVKSTIAAMLEWTQGLGYWGYLVLIVAYIAATVLFVPGTLLTLAAGFLFGVVRGSITVSVASTTGAAAAFLVGRYLARRRIEQKVAGSPEFSVIDEAVGRQGFKIVLLTRLSPIFPFNLLNYAFGLTRVRFGSYVLASWIGMIPGTVLYVYLGSTAKDLAQLFAGDIEGGTGQQAIKIVGLIATVAIAVFVARIAGQALKQAVPKSSQETIKG